MQHDVPQRPDPEQLPAQRQWQEQRARGRLRIYLGMAPGVGKTYAMLHEARRRLARRSADVVVGYVETYGRPLTVQALEGLEVIPRRRVTYQGVTLEEMDTDAIIARRPDVVCVDELAHTNTPGSRNEKRWQDVEVLRMAGITVISTLNIQHLESLNGFVENITGVHVRETVPDWVVDQADEVELVDISPEALRSRMRHGNIYPTQQAEAALERFFQTENLAALRRLALQRTMQEVDDQIERYITDTGRTGLDTAERILVAITHHRQSKVVLRQGWRLAHGLRGELLAVTVNTGARLDMHEQADLEANLRLAEDLGARTIQITGPNPERALGDLARREHVSHIVLGRAATSRRWRPWHKPIVLRLLALVPMIDVHIIAARPQQ